MDTKTAAACCMAFWERETFPHDHDAVARHGLPKYGCGTKLRLGSTSGALVGHEFVVQGMFWSDAFGTWVYYVPEYNFYQSEIDLEAL